MTVAIQFKDAVELGLSRHEQDEWAIARAQDSIVANLPPHEAFSAITDVLRGAVDQQDPFCFATYCWFVLRLARIADTSELPSDALVLIPALHKHARLLGEPSETELANVFKWFRVSSNYAIKGTSA